MFNKRVKFFVALITVLLLLSMLRLSQMQLLKNSFYRGKITELKRQRWRFRQLKTIRGTILDRKQRPIAADSPRFTLNIGYELGSFFDDRIIESRRAAAQQNDPKLSHQIDTKKQELKNIIGKCAQLKGASRTEITNEINRINDYVWGQRTFHAWRRKFPNAELIEEYKSIISVPLNEAIEDFKQKIPDRKERLKLISETDIAEMHKRYALLELETDDDIFTAQLEFMNTDDIQIVAEGRRTYFYDSVACQTIGWVGPATQTEDRELFADDKLLRYLTDDVCGREDGTEFVCEPLLRGRRGEEVYDIDHQLVKRSETQFGDDITLTLDIELQKRIEDHIKNVDLEPYGPGFSVVIIEVSTGDILALVSLPEYDLHTARYNYNKLISDPNKPLINRAIYELYPPGSVVKPLILIAGLESGEIGPEEIISCLPQPAPEGWPNCWLYNRYNYLGHDTYWANNARNAIRGSCNIYFSQLADRIEPRVLQKWLFNFGYGHKFHFAPENIQKKWPTRTFRQAQGIISSTYPPDNISDVNDLPPLKETERRFFGIGQGNLRVTVLQVANAMAIIARGGLYKKPRLFLRPTSDERGATSDEISLPQGIPKRINISESTLEIIRDGMHAVVSEIHGTAYKEFQHTGFDEQNVKVYGKTGSTEDPDHAWFAGFAEDHIGRGLSIALVVEGGQHGSSDAAPLARNIIQFCIEEGYIGKAQVGLN
ncbi:penicillin-binding transpeptidase domain-containing protein [Planctomycetota bacterium]